jgi:hypothetical protein
LGHLTPLSIKYQANDPLQPLVAVLVAVLVQVDNGFATVDSTDDSLDPAGWTSRRRSCSAGRSSLSKYARGSSERAAHTSEQEADHAHPPRRERHHQTVQVKTIRSSIPWIFDLSQSAQMESSATSCSRPHRAAAASLGMLQRLLNFMMMTRRISVRNQAANIFCRSTSEPALLFIL